MMKKEFEKRIGLVISAGEYEEIEKAYMGLPESVDKDKFAKIWLREGGIQDLFDRRLARIQNRQEEIDLLTEEKNDYFNSMNKNEAMIIELRRKVKALEGILDEIAGSAGKRPA